MINSAIWGWGLGMLVWILHSGLQICFEGFPFKLHPLPVATLYLNLKCQLIKSYLLHICEIKIFQLILALKSLTPFSALPWVFRDERGSNTKYGTQYSTSHVRETTKLTGKFCSTFMLLLRSLPFYVFLKCLGGWKISLAMVPILKQSFMPLSLSIWEYGVRWLFQWKEKLN